VAPRPVLTGAACTGGTPGTLLVTGERFTPGGEVAIVLSAPGSPRPTVVRALRASQSVTGPNGSADPARGFQRGGLVGIAIGHACQEGATLIRAYDHQSATWSTGLTTGRSGSVTCSDAAGDHLELLGRHPPSAQIQDTATPDVTQKPHHRRGVAPLPQDRIDAETDLRNDHAMLATAR
jgi:hypothetical protein